MSRRIPDNKKKEPKQSEKATISNDLYNDIILLYAGHLHREIQCRAKPTIKAQILLVKLSMDNMGYHQDHC